jgi:type II secretory pathway pseudopilin PulG
MIELLVAMSVFSFMLLIIVVGFINVVRLHNQALASNAVQDNARSAMDELVRAVRNSAAVVTPNAVGAPSSTLCLANASGPQQKFYLVTGPAPTFYKTLYQGDNCTAAPSNTRALTSAGVNVADFAATLDTGGAGIVKPEVRITVTVASNNGTTTGSGATVACNNSNADRQFCSTMTLTSGAVPR